MKGVTNFYRPPLPVPLGLKIIGWLCILSCIYSLLQGVAILALLCRLENVPITEFGIPILIILVSLAALIFVGVGIMRLRKSAWYVVVVANILAIVIGLVNAIRKGLWLQDWKTLAGFAVNLIILFLVVRYLVRPQIRALFGVRLVKV